MQPEEQPSTPTTQSDLPLSAILDRIDQLQKRLDYIDAKMTAAEDDPTASQEEARLRSELRASRNELVSLRSRKSVRLALRFADVAYPFAKRLRGLSRFRFKRRPNAGRMERALRNDRPNNGPKDGPLVSMIVLTRDGADHLARLFEGLENNTHYRSFEVIVVDNGSTDETASILDQPWSFPVRVVRNEENHTYSVANNQGLEVSEGEFVLLLNNDISPINRGWLGALVETVAPNENVAGAGALLIYPAATGRDDARPLTVQHRGIAFSWKDRAPRPVNLGAGEDPTAAKSKGVTAVPAITGACALFRRSALEQVGGLTEGYVYGWEDVDLSMKLRREGGEVVFCGDAALYHHEFGTQSALGTERRRINYLGNSRRFLETWQPFLHRALLKDQLDGTGFWATNAKRTAAITLTDSRQSAGFGDWYTAHELGDQLEELGWEVSYAQRTRDEWDEIPRGTDLIINLLPQFDVTQAPDGAFTVAWVRNWVDRWLENPSFRYYDLAVASTEVFANAIDASSEVDTAVLPLATNPDRFRPTDSDVALEADYTFTGSFWGKGRELERYLDVRPNETFTIFGKGWDRRPRGQRYWRGHLEYDRLPTLYSSVKIVLDDTVEPNLPAVNSRVFDALASGALVLSDNPTGSDEWFDGLLPSYTNRVELREQLDKYLTDDAARTSLATRLREIVLERHTYRRRAEQVIHGIHEHIKKPSIAIRIGPPAWDVAEQWGDTHFARHFARALRSEGWSTRISVVPEWDDFLHQDVDVVLHIRGLTPYTVKPGHFNVMWIISHPDDITPEECDKYDLVLVASELFAEELAGKVEVPVEYFPQATFIAAVPERQRHGIVFVGNSNRERRSVKWAIEAGFDVDVYGDGWAGVIPERHIKGDHVANVDLADLYSRYAIVLNDHWPDMARNGFISNRVFDVLAAGTMVISDEVAGIDEFFGTAVPTYSSQEELASAIVGFLENGAKRAECLGNINDRVRREHSFGSRARRFTELTPTAQTGEFVETASTPPL